MKLTLKGTQHYWFHRELISLIMERTSWNAQKTKDFLGKNEFVHFKQVQETDVRHILDRLEAAGFDIQLQQIKNEIIASLGIPYEKEFESLKKEFSEISSRLDRLEKLQKIKSSSHSIKESSVYQGLSQITEPSQPVPMSIREQQTSKATAESNIGKYWLSRIGMFTLILGIVLFIGYSFQFIGPWGKILTGAGIGGILIGLGNYLSYREEYRKWAMVTIGGGWAILYFTVYAAYHIPVTQVITSPLIGFGYLLAVAIGSICQSLKFKSPVMVFFSYFLGYVAITMVEVSFYTLVASFFLAISIVIVTKKMRWSLLALLGLAAVYLTHYAWVQPTIFGMGNSFYLTDALILPWVGEEWRVHPLITSQRSILHQSFLILYWVLFTVFGFIKYEKTSQNSIHDENLNLTLLLANSFIFTASYVYHLHVYYPNLKYIFPLAMGVLFLFLFWAEHRMGRRLFADLYLAFSTTLFSLAVPMYFDGPWITYAWAAGSVILMWLGVRNNRKILRIISWILGGVVALRLLYFDYLENQILFEFVLPVRSLFPIFVSAGVAYLTIFKVYSRNKFLGEKERRIAENIFLISAFLSLAFGFLLGGFRTATSVLWILQGTILMFLGVLYQRFSLRVVSGLFLFFGALRLANVDYSLDFLKMFSEPKITVRLMAGGISIFALLWVGDWLRRKMQSITNADLFISRIVTVAGAILVLCYFYDPGLSSWVSMIWGVWAFVFIVFGFAVRDKLYRWSGLGMFAMVLLRLFFHDFSKLETIYRIISFIGLGVVFIGASFLYSYYSKIFLTEQKMNSSQ